MKILICDDSALARKALHRAIAKMYNAEVLFAEHGKEALDVLAKHEIDLLFLDLTMPVLDGFGVLKSMPVTSYPTQVVVVSGDVQQEAKNRCMDLGASDFIAKPIKQDQLKRVFEQFHIAADSDSGSADELSGNQSISPEAKFRELTNIAVGRCAALISDRVGEFINMPLPSVGVLEPSDLCMTVTDILQSDVVSAVAQRFIGGGIYGQALVSMRGEGFNLIGTKIGYSQELVTENEIILNISNLLVATYLNALSELMNIDFSIRQPTLIDNVAKEQLALRKIHNPAFCVEFTYIGESLDFHCDVLLLIDTCSVPSIHKAMEVF